MVLGNYKGSSKGMEAESFRRCMDWLDEHHALDKVKIFVTDQDSSVINIIKSDSRLAMIKLLHDPGHYKNNFNKDLKKIMGESIEAVEYIKRIGNWLMVAIKESIKWRKLLNDKHQNINEKLERKNLIEEFRKRMECAKSHYFSPLCDPHCPCTSPKYSISTIFHSLPFQDIQQIVELFTILLQVLPNEQSVFFQLGLTCKAYYYAWQTPDLQQKVPMRIRLPKTKWFDDKGNEKKKKKIEETKSLITKIIEKAKKFVHPYHTCYNESLNHSRTVDAPKSHIYYSYEGRASLAPLRWNFGPGTSLSMIFDELGLVYDKSIKQYFQLLDKRAKNEQKRKKSLEYKKRQIEIQKNRTIDRKKEKELSQKKNDYYLDLSQKTTNPIDQTLNPYPTVDSLEVMKGKELIKLFHHHQLILTYQGDSSVAGKRKRLMEFLSNPNIYLHYKKRPKTVVSL